MSSQMKKCTMTLISNQPTIHWSKSRVSRSWPRSPPDALLQSGTCYPRTINGMKDDIFNAEELRELKSADWPAGWKIEVYNGLHNVT